VIRLLLGESGEGIDDLGAHGVAAGVPRVRDGYQFGVGPLPRLGTSMIAVSTLKWS